MVEGLVATYRDVGPRTAIALSRVVGGRFNPTIADYRKAMGIDWMNRSELSQAVPGADSQLKLYIAA